MQNHLINSWTTCNLCKLFLTDGFHSLCKAQCFQLSFTVHTLLGTKSLRFCPISSLKIFGVTLNHTYMCVRLPHTQMIHGLTNLSPVKADICVLSLWFVSNTRKRKCKIQQSLPLGCAQLCDRLAKRTNVS